MTINEDMLVELAWFEPNEDPDWPFSVHVIGTGFSHRAIPLVATVGETRVEQIAINPDQNGFSGWMREEPADGALLRIGWLDGPMFETDTQYQRQGNV